MHRQMCRLTHKQPQLRSQVAGPCFRKLSKAAASLPDYQCRLCESGMRAKAHQVGVKPTGSMHAHQIYMDVYIRVAGGLLEPAVRIIKVGKTTDGI